MRNEQDNKCAICEQPETTKRYDKVMELSVDHDHETGQVRGLLCCTCNRALGLFKDSSTILKKATNYFEKYYG